jgi:hypothetical protein
LLFSAAEVKLNTSKNNKSDFMLYLTIKNYFGLFKDEFN